MCDNDDDDDDDDDDNCVIRTMMLMTTTSTSLNDFDLLGCMELSLSPAEMEKRSQERPKGQEMDKDTKGVQLEADFYFTYNLNPSVVGTTSWNQSKRKTWKKERPKQGQARGRLLVHI